MLFYFPRHSFHVLGVSDVPLHQQNVSTEFFYPTGNLLRLVPTLTIVDHDIAATLGER